MKLQRILLAVAALAALVCITLLAQPREVSPTRQMMRQKLDHAQSVLEGISMADFELIRNHSARLGALSQEAGWRAYDTPEYAQQSVLFKRTVDALLKAGKEENLDAATLAYTKMTFSCVECHKYIRTRSVALSSASTQEDL
jgi:cytochrome c556